MVWGCQPNTQPATWRIRLSLFVWVIALDLCDMGGPTSSVRYRQHSSWVHMNMQAPPLRQSRDTFVGGGNKYVNFVSKMKSQRSYPPNHTAFHPRKLESSVISPWSPEMSQPVVTRMVFCVHLKAIIRTPTCYRMARKKADTASTDFHQQNAVSSIPVGQSLVWMEIKGQSDSGQVTVGEDTTLLVKAVLPGDIQCHSQVLLNMSQPTSHNYLAV